MLIIFSSTVDKEPLCKNVADVDLPLQSHYQKITLFPPLDPLPAPVATLKPVAERGTKNHPTREGDLLAHCTEFLHVWELSLGYFLERGTACPVSAILRHPTSPPCISSSLASTGWDQKAVSRFCYRGFRDCEASLGSLPFIS